MRYHLLDAVTPDGTARQVANGRVVTPDNATLIIAESFGGRLTAFAIAADGSLSNRRGWAEGRGPGAICMDVEGALWAQPVDHPRGAVLARIDHDRTLFGVMLGGPDRRTLFLLARSGAASST